ncbi:SPW repeat domain-containing protein [Lacunimicrobium album]
MRFISTRTHAMADYLGAVLLIVGPFVSLSTSSWGLWIPVFAGTIILLQSLFTKYELSYGRIIPMNAHLTTDFVLGFLLLVSPWMFSFSYEMYLPHVVLGIGLMAGALFTKLKPADQTYSSPKPTM